MKIYENYYQKKNVRTALFSQEFTLIPANRRNDIFGCRLPVRYIRLQEAKSEKGWKSGLLPANKDHG